MIVSKPESVPSTHTTRRAFIRDAGTAAAAWTVGAGLAARPAGARVIGANDRINFAMIGCGGRATPCCRWSRSSKTRALNVEIVAVCDIYRPRLEKTAERYNAKAYSNHKELLADPSIDVVGIATPDHIHGYQIIDAVKAGKDVYCEKPVTHWRQFELTKQLPHEVSKSDRVFQLGSQYMSDSAWGQARQMIKEGLIGRPVHAEFGFFRVGDWGERGMPIDDPNAKPGPDLNWEAFLGDSPKREFDVSRFFRWRMYWDYAGGPATDLYPHCLSQVIHMLDVKLPSLVVATGGKLRYEEREVPDTFNILAEYPEKISLSMIGTQANDYPGIAASPAGLQPGHPRMGSHADLRERGDRVHAGPGHQEGRQAGQDRAAVRPRAAHEEPARLLPNAGEGRVPGRSGVLHADPAADGHPVDARRQGGPLRRGG